MEMELTMDLGKILLSLLAIAPKIIHLIDRAITHHKNTNEEPGLLNDAAQGASLIAARLNGTSQT